MGRYLCWLLLAVCWGCASAPTEAGPDAVSRAEQMLEDGRANEARRLLESMDRDARGDVVLADAWRRLGREEQAIAAYWRARDAGDAAVRFRANAALGEIALARRDGYLARVRFDEAHQDAPDEAARARSGVGRARTALLLGDVERAVQLRSEITDGTAAGLAVLDSELAVATAPKEQPAEVARANKDSGKDLTRVSRKTVSVAVPGILRRGTWRARPVRPGGRPQPMGRVTRVTLHHTATKRLPGSSRASNAQLLRTLQADHQNGRRWADLGYHYVIDRQGRVWEGREMRWQGAHAGNGAANRHNVGIALVGDFDRYAPTAPQKRSLQSLVRWICAKHDIVASRIQGHGQVLKAFTGGGTACPGRHLAAYLGELRRAVDSDRRAAAGL